MTLTDKRRPHWLSAEWFHVLVAIFTLVTFSLSQCLYDLLAANNRFLSFRMVTNAQLLAIIFVFNWLPAVALFGLWAALRRLQPKLARGYLWLVYSLLFLVFFLQVHNHPSLTAWQAWENSYLIWLVPAGLLALLSLRFPRAFRSYVLALSPVVFLFPLLFLYQSWNQGEGIRLASLHPSSLFPERNPPLKKPRGLTPVFVIVFDELTLPALLNEDGQVDAARFPNFKTLADQSYWFPNATANADYTSQSIPTLLTGNFPLSGNPTASHWDYPQNLLTWLESDYDIYLYESWTRFCVPERFHCMGLIRLFVPSSSNLFRDIFYLSAKRVVPKELDAGLDARVRQEAFWDGTRLTRARMQHMEQLVATVGSLPKEHSLFFLVHFGLPHHPYLLSPDGEITETPFNQFAPWMKGHQAELERVWKRYQAQIMYVDRQVGRLLAQLKQRGLYEQSLLIVTADHGVSYKPEAPGRSLREVDGTVVNADLILSVPFFVKLPYQKQGVISPRDVQLIDMVPTVADVLGRTLPWPCAGRSVFDPVEGQRAKVAYDSRGNRYELPLNFEPGRIQRGVERLGHEQREVAALRGD